MNQIKTKINVDEVLGKLNLDFGLATKYTIEQVREALLLINEIGMNATSTKLGISKSTLRSWRNPGRNSLYLTNRYKKNPEKFRKIAREQHKKDPTRFKEINRRAAHKLYHTNPNWRIRALLRTRIWKTIKDQKATKLFKFGEYIGCPLDEFMKIFEAKFKQGMNWDNYGLWHIDHIIPCSSFDLTKQEEQKKCFHHTNLQPLWAKQNLDKGDSLPSVAFINCVSQKRDYKCQASEMYEHSPIFRNAKDYVQTHYDQYFILSAFHGLLHPNDIIEPYPNTCMINTALFHQNGAIALTIDERKLWAQSVFNTIDWTKFSKIHFYVGYSYWEQLEPLFKTANIPAERFELPQGVGNVINAFKQDNLTKSNK